MRSPARWLVIALGPGLALLALLYLGREEAETPPLDPSAPLATAHSPPGGRAPAPLGTEPTAASGGAALPSHDVARILPPQAALEDLRDALAGVAAPDLALPQAFAALRELAARGGVPADQLRTLVAGLIAPTQRRLGIVALGAWTHVTTQTWMLRLLERRPPNADSLSALIALSSAQPGEQGTKVAIEDGVWLTLGPVAKDVQTERALRAFLDQVDASLAQESFLFLLAALGSTPRLAWLMRSDGSAAPVVAHLNEAQRSALLARVQAMPDIDPRVAQALRAVAKPTDR